MIRRVGTVLAAVMWAAAAQAGCGADPAACIIATGTYHVALPPDAARAPAVVFLHGFGGSGEGSLSNTGMVDALLARGYAVIAPDGLPRADGQRRAWAFHSDRPGSRDEVAFLAGVADDAALRFGLNRDAMLLSGFSIGGSMATYLACAAPGTFRAYAPVAGSFWRPHPADCTGPAALFHLHGWTDGTVPLEGRVLRSGIVQGDVFAALDIWRRTNDCALQPDAFGVQGDVQLRSWTACAPGARLDFGLHPGGHTVPPVWATLALDWFEALP
ncbi:MAG: alpha/beta fold hydrolase [Rhodobacteraceae bacterium]|nr:alpha/beta fold hydrolase [Paracoccaceae bacterium]